MSDCAWHKHHLMSTYTTTTSVLLPISPEVATMTMTTFQATLEVIMDSLLWAA